MSNIQVWYRAGDEQDEWFRFMANEFDTNDAVIERCAEEYFWDHDGWDTKSWVNVPIRFALRKEKDGPIVGQYDVELEHVPSFTANEVAEGGDGE